MTKPTPLHPNKRDSSQVEVLTGMGATREYIAHHLSLTVPELEHHYARSLRMGEEEANLRVAQAFFEMATSKEHPQMTLAWMKMRARWTDTATSTQEEDDVDIEATRQKLLKLINRSRDSNSATG